MLFLVWQIERPLWSWLKFGLNLLTAFRHACTVEADKIILKFDIPIQLLCVTFPKNMLGLTPGALGYQCLIYRSQYS